MPRVFRFREYGGPEVQEFAEVPMPEAGPSELLVKVKSAAVNPVDYKRRSGLMQQVVHLDLPAEFGSELSGFVEEVGKDVDGFAAGDRVFGYAAPGHGAFCEYTVVSAGSTAKMPPHLDFHDAATLPVAGGNCLRRNRAAGAEAGPGAVDHRDRRRSRCGCCTAGPRCRHRGVRDGQ